jgi:6-bladed beta-propeller protein
MHHRFMILTVTLLQSITVASSVIAAQRPSGGSTAQEVILRAKRIAQHTLLDHPRRVLPGPDGNFYVLDAGNHRIVVFSPTWVFLRQISEVGQGPGELFDPYDFAFDRAGNVYVVDGKKRVQWFSPLGKFLGGFRYEKECLAIGVNARGEILLSQPGLGALVIVYGGDGKQHGSFGSLKAGDSRYQAVANRVHVQVTRTNDIYVSFDHQGLLQKYDAGGRLLWEVAIPGEPVERMRRIFWSDAIDKAKHGMVVTTMESGLPAFCVAFNLFFDETRRHLYVPLNDGSIYVADALGKRLQLMKQPQGAVDFYNSIAIDSAGRILVTSVWKGVFLITPARPA